ncbi:hypothetical protein D030_5172B, partial [Vibrio parahaemolyticus AQ3810]
LKQPGAYRDWVATLC